MYIFADMLGMCLVDSRRRRNIETYEGGCMHFDLEHCTSIAINSHVISCYMRDIITVERYKRGSTRCTSTATK